MKTKKSPQIVRILLRKSGVAQQKAHSMLYGAELRTGDPEEQAAGRFEGVGGGLISSCR